MKEKISQLFLKFDKIVFTQIDIFKQSPVYNKIQNSFSLIDDDYRPLANNAIVLFLIILPFIVIGPLWYNNRALKNEVEQKKNILQIANRIIAEKRSVQEASNQVFSPEIITDIGAFSARVTSAVSSMGITQLIRVENFEVDEQAGVTKAMASIIFNRLSNNDIVTMTSLLMQNSQLKIAGISVKKDPSEQLLSGSLSVVFYGKQVAMPETGAEE